MDRVRWYYYLKDGFSIEKEESIESFTDVMIYWKPFEVKAVKRIISEFPDSVIDFGAGHSYYTDTNQFNEVRDTLAIFFRLIQLIRRLNQRLALSILASNSNRSCCKDLQNNTIHRLTPSKPPSW